MGKNSPIPTRVMVMVLTIHIIFSIGKSSEVQKCPVPTEVANLLHSDLAAIQAASTNYGNIVKEKPAAVLYPSSAKDISNLINSSYSCRVPFGIAARGNGHSVRGQDLVLNGVVVDMLRLRLSKKGNGVTVSQRPLFADVGGEQLWIDVLNSTLKKGVAPVSWTDFLYLSVGGTLSNAGISGQTFRFGPQISNVYEMDIVTGKGELLTCSANKNSELFYGTLGGLGQFGVITRARIALGRAPQRVSWLRLLYSNFSAYTKDQENLIANNNRTNSNALDYLEGALLLDNGTPNTWRTSFFPHADIPRILSLIKQHGIIYCLEIARNYDVETKNTVNKELEQLVKTLSFVPTFNFKADVSYEKFLTRVQIGNNNKQSHPWLNLFIPKSRILDFNSGVLRDIILKRNITTGPALFYPMNRNKWDNRMSAAIPDEDIFYTLGLLYAIEFNDLHVYDDQNKAILQFCENASIKIKQYLPNYTTKNEWIKHFGSKWTTFQKRKAQFDPKMILSPGQKIFNNS